jgi:ABC-type transporter Mla subunit MlaD
VKTLSQPASPGALADNLKDLFADLEEDLGDVQALAHQLGSKAPKLRAKTSQLNLAAQRVRESLEWRSLERIVSQLANEARL